MRAHIERAGYWRRVRNGYYWIRLERNAPVGKAPAFFRALYDAWVTRNEWVDDSTEPETRK